jgi:hypothetical protein
VQTTKVWTDRLPSEAYRTRYGIEARFSMCRDTGQDGRLIGLYIPVSFVVLRRIVLRVALARGHSDADRRIPVE